LRVDVDIYAVNAAHPARNHGRPAFTATYAVNAAHPARNRGRPALTGAPANRRGTLTLPIKAAADVNARA